MVAGKPGSEGAARTGMGLNVEHRQHKGLNNRTKNAPADAEAREDHQAVHIRPTPEAPVFIHDGVANLHNCPRPAMSSSDDRALRSGAMVAWRGIAEPGIAA
jgi:putative transposase